MTLGALAFLSPWLLTALAALPLIYWLLKTVPPRPRQINFPATRILVGLENEERTPASTPWWLLLIRLLAAALVIFALADPVLNPAGSKALKGSGPIVIVVDNGWAAAPGWARRQTLAERFINEAQSQNRPVMIVETAPATKARAPQIQSPNDARATLAALEPRPYAPDRKGTLAAVQAALGKSTEGDPSVLWLADGIDHDGSARAFADGLSAASRSGTFAIVSDSAGDEALGLSAGVGSAGALTAKVVRSGGPQREGMIYAYSARGQRLGETPYKLGPGDRNAEATFELPLEIRNQVTRLEIPGATSAGAVNLLDGRSQWQRVALLSGESQEQSQPLLAPLYYIEKAIKPFAEIVRPRDHNLEVGVDETMKQRASVLMLADIGTLSGDVKERIEAWVKRGGVLVRFAGPRLENGGDDLLPVALRTGGRTLGGALSWSTPQPLAAFDETSLFAGLTVPKDVNITRQVLADPAELNPSVKVWARLGDGTPLVTASSLGAGQIILFHITANSDWSNLPISGLFVDMLRRITALGTLASAHGGDEASTPQRAASAEEQVPAADALAPVQTLDGFGALRQPPPTAEAIPASKFSSVSASLIYPPGYYGPAASPRSLNVVTPTTQLAPLPQMPRGSEQLGYESEAPTPLMPWLLTAAFALILADMIAVLAMMGGSWWKRLLKPHPRAAMLLLAMTAGSTMIVTQALAQTRAPGDGGREFHSTATDAIAQKATEKVTLGYVLTGDATADETSRTGLWGLSRVLAVRTAVEPGDPIGIDIVKDEISFYPVLYWPVVENAKALPQSALAKIDAYMKQGGMIIFDTRDANTGLPSGTGLEGPNTTALQRLLGSLDVPRLEPVPEDHVLTKSFYLLRTFPGRWDNGALWVEAGAQGENDGEGRKARRADGVSSIVITSNDFASAWALDASGRPLYPVVPGGENQREMALRTGINIVMHALTGNYKADQVHVPALLERLGQ